MNRIPSYGSFKSDLITDTSALSGHTWSHINILEATVFTSLTGTIDVASGSYLSGATFPAGCIIAGNFTELELASGAVLAYRSED